jgi:hypothetical protein
MIQSQREFVERNLSIDNESPMHALKDASASMIWRTRFERAEPSGARFESRGMALCGLLLL